MTKKYLGEYEINFSEPDQFGQIHSNIETFLDINESVVYVNLKINGGESIKFHLNYWDAGTVGHARMKNQYAIGGRLTNVSMNWAKPKKKDVFKIINVVGITDNGKARLHLWLNNPIEVVI